MELQGKVIAVLPERSGVSARGEWKSQTYVIETQEQYPKKMAFDVFGADRIASFDIQLGEVINVSFDIDAHEYQGRFLIRFVLGMLFIKRNKLLYKVVAMVAMFSLAHRRHNKLWQVLLMLLAWQTRRISKVCFHLHSHSNRNLLLHLLIRSLLMTCPSSVELIKRAFNAYVVQSEKCV